MSCESNSNRRRQSRMPLIVILGCGAVIAYCTFFASTFDSIQTRHKTISKQSNSKLQNQNGFKDELGSREGASDKTYVSKAKSKRSCKSFDHGDTSPTPGVKSLFNCNSEEGKCKWHFPAKFFDQLCGVGKDFFPDVENLQKLHKNGTLWLDGPPIVIPWASIHPGVTSHKFRKEPYPVHNLSMTHVHKTGGTSLVNAFGSILRYKATGKRHLVYMPGKSNPRLPKVSKTVRNRTSTRTFQRQPYNNSKSYIEVNKFMNGAVKYQSEWGQYDHTLFAVIRDPAERFISAIGQATGAFGSTSNGIGKQLLDECIRTTPKETLTCFVDLVHNNGTLIEVHFTPMAFEISFATMWKDIPVAVFPFQEVPSLLNELGNDPSLKKKDGHKTGYRKHPVLTNMTSADYDLESITKLCKIYWVDVLFLNHIGYESNCDWLLKGTEFPGIDKEEASRPVSSSEESSSNNSTAL